MKVGISLAKLKLLEAVGVGHCNADDSWLAPLSSY